MRYDFKDKSQPEAWADGRVRKHTPQELAYMAVHGRRLWMKLYYEEIDEEIRAFAKRVDIEDWRFTDPCVYGHLKRMGRKHDLTFKNNQQLQQQKGHSHDK